MVEVRIPEREAPRPAVLAAVGGVALAAGLLLAWWGTSAAPEGRGEEARGGAEATREGAGRGRGAEEGGA
ncbi:MAG TPA: hypothetical protein RMH99_06585, partial [Sandaracinaceae bacterium LLY-WYZ-13_1]|nr:hypothetical protein [Sandaracinaceae bacterium LLY-WYZ-13_1]